MWQAFRDEHVDQGFEVVTVGMDTAGADACRPFMEAAPLTHPSLIDQHHRTAELFGVVNIPNGVWIDEGGMIVRPAETAPAPPSLAPERQTRLNGDGMPERVLEMGAQAAKISYDRDSYEAALRDWIAKGADSEFALSAEQVIERSRPRSTDTSLGQAHFELATQLELDGNHAAAVGHFTKAHELVPDNFAYRRQAWSLEPGPEGPLNRFWQGPMEGAEADWPYEGDWLIDTKAMGAENYYEPFVP